MKTGVGLVLVAFLTHAFAATPKEYETFFGSSYNGLGLSSSEAATWAGTESAKLSDSGITIPTLQKIRSVLYLPTDGLGLSMPEVRQWILPLAYAHASPEKLGALFKALWLSGCTGCMSLPKSEAQSRAIELSLRQAEPETLKALYQVIYIGLSIPRAQAQPLAIEQAAAGADAATFKATYAQARTRGLSPTSCAAIASREAVKATLQGLVRRHAKDTILYTADEFQKHYGDTWLNEWLASPFEQRVAQDGFQYTAVVFAEYYGSSWISHWASSNVATQVRIAQDGKKYTMKEFADYYKEDWQRLWDKAAEIRCQECSPYPSQSSKEMVV